jgi:hypothetical protein
VNMENTNQIKETKKQSWFERHKIITWLLILCGVLPFLGGFISAFIPTKVTQQAVNSTVGTPTPISSDPCASYPITNNHGMDRITCERIHAAATDTQHQSDIQVNQLNGSVKFDNVEVLITNNETMSWSCEAGIDFDPNADSNYLSDDFNVNPNTTVSVAWKNFAGNQGQRFDYFTTKPKSVTLFCDVRGKKRETTFNLNQ